jgi:hypothetical protein
MTAAWRSRPDRGPLLCNNTLDDYRKIGFAIADQAT